MKYLWRTTPLLLVVVVSLLIASCKQATPQTALLQGAVTIGPIFPVEIPGESRPVPPEVFSSRQVMIYDESGKKLVWEVIITQIDQTASGYYAVTLTPGIYTVDFNHQGIDRAANLPRKITAKANDTITIDIDIDTGIR